MGSGLQRAYSETLLLSVTKLDEKCSLVLVIWDPKAYKISEKKPQVTEVRGTLGKLWMAQKWNFGQRFLFFFGGPAKSQLAKFSKKCPKTL